MKPPYKITGKILKLVASISEKIGEVNSAHLNKSSSGLSIIICRLFCVVIGLLLTSWHLNAVRHAIENKDRKKLWRITFNRQLVLVVPRHGFVLGCADQLNS